MKTVFKRKIMPAGLSSNAVIIPAPLLGMFNVTKGDTIIFEWDMETNHVSITGDRSLENINVQFELPFEETSNDKITRLPTESNPSVSERTDHESWNTTNSIREDDHTDYTC